MWPAQPSAAGVSSGVRARAAPAGISFPSISTSGGFPGEKKRSLIFGDTLSIAASRSGVEMGAAARAAVAVRGADATTLSAGLIGEDIFQSYFPLLDSAVHLKAHRASNRCPCFRLPFGLGTGWA